MRQGGFQFVAGSLALSVGIAAVPSHLGLRDPPTDSAPHEPVSTTTPVSVGRVAWRTELPEGAGTIVAGGPGVMLFVLDGVISVDGVTGKVAWRYRSDAEVMTNIEVTADGTTAFLTTRTVDEHELTVLDATTGEERFVIEQAALFAYGRVIGWTDDAMLMVDDDDVMSGLSVQDGKELWSRSLPDVCSGIHGLPTLEHASPSGVLVSCRSALGTHRVAYVDSESGDVQWTHRRGQWGDGVGAMSSSPDGLIAYIPEWDLEDGGQSADGAIIAIESGDVLAPGSFAGALVNDGVSASWTSNGDTIRFDDLFEGRSLTIERACECGGLAILPAGILWPMVSGTHSGSPVFQSADDGALVEIADVRPSDFPNSMIATVAPGAVVLSDGIVSHVLVGLT